MAKRSSLSRTDVRYWRTKIRRNVRADGHAARNYSVQIGWNGRRVRFALGTPNADEAARLARERYLAVRAQGWEAVLARFKPQPEVGPVGSSTIGDLIREVRSTVNFRESTFAVYCQSLRRIAAGVAQLEGRYVERSGARKGDSRCAPNKAAAWWARVDAVELSTLTNDAIQHWKLSHLRAAKTPEDARRAANSVNSVIRNARALFSSRALEFARPGLNLPQPLPFAGMKLERRGNSRYVSRIDAGELLAAAQTDLAANETRREQWKILCLALFAGLRKREIDTLLWRSIDLERRVIQIEATEFFQPKTEESLAEIALDDEFVALLRGWKARASGEFVVESREAPSTHPKRYRIQEHVEPLYAWLREHGVNDRKKPLHSLRKELGAVVATARGIFAAARILRHSDIRTTQAYYADQKDRVTSGMGGLLASNIAPIEAAPSDRRSSSG